MTTKQLFDLLTTSGLPIAYRQWDASNVPALPYVVYYATLSNPFGADNRVYSSAQQYCIELYANRKDREAEQALELALGDLFYTKEETYIDSEKLTVIIYEIEV